ncbi:MAG: cupin domain-containing protein [Deltaproteobacteria bacterium]|nr:cupin domain-containing protein [Deltaproteobacteria bacterium]
MAERVLQIDAGRHQIFRPQAGVTLRLLHAGSGYQAFLIDVESGTSCQSSPHDGQELRYVVSGTVVFSVAGDEHVVGAGGTLHHRSSVPHGFRTEDQPACFVTFALSRDYDIRRLLRGLAEGES